MASSRSIVDASISISSDGSSRRLVLGRVRLNMGLTQRIGSLPRKTRPFSIIRTRRTGQGTRLDHLRRPIAARRGGAGEEKSRDIGRDGRTSDQVPAPRPGRSPCAVGVVDGEVVHRPQPGPDVRDHRPAPSGRERWTSATAPPEEPVSSWATEGAFAGRRPDRSRRSRVSDGTGSSRSVSCHGSTVLTTACASIGRAAAGDDSGHPSAFGQDALDRRY